MRIIRTKGTTILTISASGRLKVILFWIVLLPLLAACGGLAGEPKIVATLPPPTSAPQDVGYPLRTPDLARGAQIFAARCTQCHGIGGKGDGQLVLSGQIARPNDFTNPTTSENQRPVDWFATITNGRLDKGMPPWKDALSEEDRWAVALYTYTLSYPNAQITRGKDLWTQNCAECHGDGGRGDGPKASQINRPVADLTRQSEIITLSDSNIFDIVTQGRGQMPAFADKMADDQRHAVVAYTRSLSLENVGSSAALPETTQEAQPATTPEVIVSAKGTVTGKVTNGTAGGSVPDNLPVTLHNFDPNFQDAPLQTTTNSDGSFTFKDVLIIQGHHYVATVMYRDNIFPGEIVTGDTNKPDVNLPITIYDLTQDPRVLQIASIEAQIDAINNGLQVVEKTIFHNSSDRLYTTDRAFDATRKISVIVALPPGAVVTGFPGNPERFSVAQDNSLVVDSVPVMPGEDHEVQFSYFLPYKDGAVLEFPVYYNTQGDLRLWINPDNVSASGSQLALTGSEKLGDTTYQKYEGKLSAKPGDAVHYELHGAGVVNTGTNTPVVTANNLLPVVIVLLILGGLMIVLIGIFYMRRQGRGNQRILIDGLIRQIAELDAQHDAGQINHDLYHQQRSALKARLAELLGEEQET
jgi:mono/diheme cytochrome c family protein